jgi:hypothetical protein
MLLPQQRRLPGEPPPQLLPHWDQPAAAAVLLDGK